MSNTTKLIVSITANAKDDQSTVAFTVANAALSKGMKVAIFLSSDAVELARTGSCDFTHIAPFKKLSDLIEGFVANGGVLWACAPCYNHRGLQSNEAIEGAVITGAGGMLDWIADGAQTLSY